MKSAIIAGCVVLSMLSAPGAHAETSAVESRNSPYAEKDYIWDCASYHWKALRSGNPLDGCVRDGNWGPVPRKLRRQQLRDLGRVPRERYVKGK
jgi:hypothetical protein